ncbi:hypothetical protein A1OE_496 [Candidatus Endolissoclinum faulkneri L2]|uniref:Uncharacterized protein n=1 Tax=Candidatus Endolissoclinum faulkneri L2 TaxID=1193729 RepID=K7YQ29_9PROT|nr:hypothetical protein A1OE_496 [Candidatus Endolissoclinum faulkneri L2]
MNNVKILKKTTCDLSLNYFLDKNTRIYIISKSSSKKRTLLTFLNSISESLSFSESKKILR